MATHIVAVIMTCVIMSIHYMTYLRLLHCVGIGRSSSTVCIIEENRLRRMVRYALDVSMLHWLGFRRAQRGEECIDATVNVVCTDSRSIETVSVAILAAV